jgi:hypothetical protein
MKPRSILALLLLAGSTLSTGCSTVIRPTRPDTPLQPGTPLAGVRFDGEETSLREPGMPLSPSRGWQREVSNYTATSLNALLATKEDAPAARTVVTFDMASPSVIQIGTWKEITIGVSSTLPDGTVVKSAPITGHIDDSLEYGVLTAASVGGTVLDATAAISILLFFVTRPQVPMIGLLALSSLVGGIALHVAHSIGQYVVAANEEGRWSNLYAGALAQHAEDIRRTVQKNGGIKPPIPAQPTGPPKLTPAPPIGPSDPADPSAPPPMLDDTKEL